MYVKTDGIVLKETEYKDNDKLLTVLTRDLGRITVKARGVKSGKSGSKAACQLLAYSEFTLFEQQGRYTVREAVSKELFLELQKDLELLALASYFAQVTLTVAQEDDPMPDLLSLLLNALYALTRLRKPQLQVKAVFELRSACISGFLPDLRGCAVCGNPTPDRFNITQGVLQCASCLDTGPESRQVTVPDLRGKNRQQCTALAGQLGLSILPDGNPELSGIAVSQEPAPGETTFIGNTVRVRFADVSASD